MSIENRTKIVGTLGPSSESSRMIEQLVRAGLDVARLNASHGTPEEHARRIRSVRAIALRLHHPVGLLLDLPGPKLRLGPLPHNPVALRPGDALWLGSSEWPLRTPALLPYLKKGHRLMLSDGLIRLEVIEVRKDRVRCGVVSAGLVHSGSGLHAPDTPFRLRFPVPADRAWIQFARQHQVDWLGVSYVRSAGDLRAVRRLIPRGQKPLILAKIETRQALDQLDSIVELADGLMVARGDLGVETPMTEIAIAQKRIISTANKRGLPVITATQMLESMVNRPTPTRAEATDVANAILDGTDAVMLSAETAAGQYPVEAVRVMADICRATESAYPEEIFRRRMDELPPLSESHAIGRTACQLAQAVKARAILLEPGTRTRSGHVARFRPAIPILRVCAGHCPEEADSLTWSTYQLSTGTSTWRSSARRWLLNRKFARTGDPVVIIEASGSGAKGSDSLSLYTLKGTL